MVLLFWLMGVVSGLLVMLFVCMVILNVCRWMLFWLDVEFGILIVCSLMCGCWDLKGEVY